jgi:hypothetical protein
MQKALLDQDFIDKNPDDDIYTPESIAMAIVKMFNPQGRILEPCKGKGAFLKYLPEGTEWCEIAEGKDFFNYKEKVDWIITNPPYSTYDKFLDHAFEIADNVVYLVPLNKVFNSFERITKYYKYGGIAKIWFIGTGNLCGFPFGFPVGAVHWKKEHKGVIEIVYGLEQNNGRKL